MIAYLAGPITSLSYDSAVDWRLWAAAVLLASGVKSLSPMRAKDSLAGTSSLVACGYEQGLGPLSGPAMVRRDLSDIRRSDVVLVNLVGADRVSLGTAAEIGYAHALGKYVVLVMEEGNVHEHVFVDEMASVRFSTLEDALDWIVAVMKP